ncbi:MAG: diguanylate cyclase [Spirochaetes bacterium]|nr:diguanylate cyclase [Spirochaetota bacterium]MBU0955742.1 diguanylate cyclase [Spirochaetota bacterium]
MNEILLVDDSELSLKVLQATLEQEGHKVITASNCQDALRLLALTTPRLIMLDIVMPDCSGLKLLETLQADEKTVHIPVIMVTSRSEADDVKTALEAGAFDYIRKPYSEIEVVARVHSALRIADYQERLLYLSTHDGLTGLYNHVTILNKLSQVLEDTHSQKKPFALLMLDLDNFKSVNDSYGHQFGDHVLQRTGQLIYEHFSKYGATGRYGGEEFCIGLKNYNQQMALRAAEAFRKLVAGLSWPGKPADYRISTSIGLVSSENSPSESIEQLVHRADKALYQAKQSGRNQVCLAGD